ncbi:hypothetical protein [Achromobacter sp. EB05]|uniref:hypothetical protein n=1 Tax=Achromobacter sp. EB05 TaxID=3142974 RepID=UPI0037840405
MSDEVDSVISHARNAPAEPGWPIGRDNVLDTIDRAFESSRIVFLEGDPLSGKTELAAQYMRRHEGFAVGAFLTAAAPIFYSATFLRLTFAEQISIAVSGSSSQQPLDVELSEALYQKYILQLQRLGRQQQITFVVDGLVDSEKVDRQSTLEIFEQLPAIQSEFRFLITGDARLFKELDLHKKNALRVPMFPLSLPESAEYLADLKLDEVNVRALHTYSSGNVGLLHKLRLLLMQGASLDDLLTQKKGTLSEIFEYEWESLRLNDLCHLVIGFIVFSHAPLDTPALSELANINSTEVDSMLGRCKFLVCDDSNGCWSIRSPAQQQFVSEKLIGIKKDVEEKLIKWLMGREGDRQATLALPSQLVAAGQHVEVLRRLSGDHFSRLLSQENSLRELKNHAEYGVISARKNGDIYSELRFSLIQSSINGTTLEGSSMHEIEALLSLGMEDAAAALALSATTAEERLRQLALAVGCFGRMGKEPPPQVLSAVTELLSDLEDELPEPVLVSIAADLFAVDIKLSLQILERSAKSARKHRRNSEGATQGPTGAVAAQDENINEAGGGQEYYSKVRPVIDAATRFVRAMSADDVLRRVEYLSEAHKLFVLQRWLEAHCRHEDAPKIALLALDIVLRDTSRSPRIRDVREIAVVAPHVTDPEISERLTTRLEVQSKELIGHGTSEESVRLRMTLLRAKHKWNPCAVDIELIDLFVEVHEVADVGIRTACYAWMLYHLGHFENKDSLDARTGIVAETTKYLIEAINMLLLQTADHYLAAVDAIRALCMFEPAHAMDLVDKINTEDRRDKGYGLIVRRIAVNEDFNENVEVLTACLGRISDRDEQERLILFVLYRVSAHLAAVSDALVDPRLLLLWRDILPPSRKMQALILTFKIVHQCAYLIKQDGLLEAAEKEWTGIRISWLKVDVGYWAVSELASVDKSIAKKWLENVREDAQKSGAPSRMAGSHLYFINCLAARIFNHYVAAHPQEFETALQRLSDYVDLLPGLEDQVQIWAQIGVALWYKSKKDFSQRIVELKIDPLLSLDFSEDRPLLEDIVFEAAPLLYLCSAAATNSRLERTFSPKRRDEARDNICATIMRKMLQSEVYQERERAEFDLTHAEASDVLSQISLMSSDAVIYKNVVRLANSLCAKKNRGTIRRNQVADLLADLENTVIQKLPDVNNIKHEGFLIACLAEIHRCKISETKNKDNGYWATLLERGRAIPNGADRAIVISMIASCASGGGVFSNGKWFEDVQQDIRTIPSDRDRLERFQWVAEILETFDKSKCRALLKEAMLASTHISDSGIIDKRQKILDLAHNIDPSFVDEIVNILDDDEASKLQKKLLKDHSRLLDAKKTAASNVEGLKLEDYSLEDLTRIAFRSVGALNAGRQIPQNMKEFMRLAEVGKHYPFPLTYPIWLWIFENGLRKATQQSAGRVLPSMFECICNVADVSLSFFQRSGGGIRKSLMMDGDTIGPGGREQLFCRIREWAGKQSEGVIHISDPYFGPDDLELVKAIAEVSNNKEIVVITSREQVNKKARGQPPEELFRDSWDKLCEGAPPPTDIVVIGFGPEGKHPIHDRWILSQNSGLRLGTSAGSIGLIRISEISEMDEKQAVEKNRAIDLILHRETRDWEGHKLHKNKFSL